ncbi:MAG: cytochrome c [Spirosomataceae bacterium]
MNTVFAVLLTAVSLAGVSFRLADETPLQKSITRGKSVYVTHCQLCHGHQGEGIEGIYPPVAKADYLKDWKKSIQSIIQGQKGPVKINGKDYNSEMENFGTLSDQEVADVMNFMYNNWGNKGKYITPEEVKSLRK